MLGLLTALLCFAGIAAPAAAAGAPAAAPSSTPAGAAGTQVAWPIRPKVAVIVGPVAEYTADYKRFANQAVAAARRDGAEIVTVYTPNATWPRVRAALQGASVVVYLGHGNGYPSPYRSDPWPYSENGFGVNVSGDRNDEDHQYFGEYYLSREVRLAPNAVVILSHLCYASGNSEPGMPDDGQDVAAQRIDNYAAGFIAAGAGAVIADARLSPSYYVNRVLDGNGSIAGIWKGAPTFNDHASAFDSRRSPGYTGYLDPDTRTTGFYHSLVVDGRLDATAVLGAAGLQARGRHPLPPLRYALDGQVRHPARIGAIRVQRAPVAGKPLAVTLPITGRPKSLPTAGMQLGVRWTPLDVPQLPATPRAGAGQSGNGATKPPAAGTPGGTDGRVGAGRPRADGNTMWIAPEQPGTVVDTEIAKVTAKQIRTTLLVPSQPGLYRLTITLSDRDGVPLGPDVVTQPSAYIVTVPMRMAVGYAAPSQVRGLVGRDSSVALTVTNTGSGPWTAPGANAKDLQLTAWVVPVGQSASPRTEPQSIPITSLAPGASAHLALDVAVPSAPGDYLLVLDITHADGTLLDASGDAADVIHLTAVTPPLPAADPVSPLPTPSSSAPEISRRTPRE
jgi:hypothetical protein